MLIFAYFTGCRRCRCESGGSTDDGHGVKTKRDGHVEFEFCRPSRKFGLYNRFVFVNFWLIHIYFYKGGLISEDFFNFVSSSSNKLIYLLFKNVCKTKLKLTFWIFFILKKVIFENVYFTLNKPKLTKFYLEIQSTPSLYYTFICTNELKYWFFFYKSNEFTIISSPFYDLMVVPLTFFLAECQIGIKIVSNYVNQSLKWT